MPGGRRLAQAVLGLLMAAAVCVPTAADDAARVMTWTINNAPRRAIVYSPTVPSPGRKALVLSFHGRGDNITNFQRTDMQRAWPQAGSCVVRGRQVAREIREPDRHHARRLLSRLHRF